MEKFIDVNRKFESVDKMIEEFVPTNDVKSIATVNAKIKKNDGLIWEIISTIVGVGIEIASGIIEEEIGIDPQLILGIACIIILSPWIIKALLSGTSSLADFIVVSSDYLVVFKDVTLNEQTGNEVNATSVYRFKRSNLRTYFSLENLRIFGPYQINLKDTSDKTKLVLTHRTIDAQEYRNTVVRTKLDKLKNIKIYNR
jgi:hypothetical protein